MTTVATLVKAIRQAPIEPGMPEPSVLVVAPPPIQAAKGAIAAKFKGAETKAHGLTDAVRDMAKRNGCDFFDAGSVTSTSRVDGVHLDEDQHLVLGKALAEKIERLLS